MDFTAVVEIGKGSYLKYEQDKDSNALVLDRVLPIPVPHSYGYIKDLPIQADGDPLDVFIVGFEPLVPLSEVKIRPLGILLCEDNGVEDNKVIAQIVDDFYQSYTYFKEIRWYLENYKQGFKVLDYKIFNDSILFRNFVEAKK